ncbi:MAG TPA: 6-oxocyclohex-1-ene-1-carbonyl-CoA hydratase [Candidatus Kapabacteria bacterium]|nr:6-oxocyclohex-1-ene-1-carbonyl-CoA hydratase [Candidatus Kapabacteria bacterium]
MRTLIDHNLVRAEYSHILFEKRPCRDADGAVVDGLYNAWIVLDNPEQFNSYLTATIKEVILAFREASNDRSVACVVFTGVGDKAFCTGGNTKQYAEYYAGNPQEYKQYMRLFNDMVSGILTCDKPVINRVNGMRIAGGQEIGMACDFSIAQDFARFGQAGPRHGSAPEGGSTDFLSLFVGIERAMFSCTVCEHWTAYEALRFGLLTDVVPALKVDGAWVPNPLVITDRWLDAKGAIVHGTPKTGADLAEAKALVARGTMDLSLLDEAVEQLCTKLLYTFPNCLAKTLGSMRKKKLEAWDRNKESNRDWLGLNMMTEAKAGFRAFNEGPKGHREVDFIRLRRLLAEGEPWSDELIREISPQYAHS